MQQPDKQIKRYFNKIIKHKDATTKDYTSNPFADNDEKTPAMRYHLTNRPVNPMLKLLPPSKRNKKAENGYYLPVMRYEGIYYSKNDNEKSIYCGKFFYFEPESNVYLYLGKSCFFATKY